MFIPLILPIYYILLWKSNDKVLFYVGLVFLVLLSSFRAFSVGVDTTGYMQSFRFAQSANLDYVWNAKEPIYYTIEYLTIRWGASYRVMMIIQTLLFLTPLTIGVNRIKEKPIAILALVVLLGFFYASLNVTRQMIAVSFCFLGYVLLEEKKYVQSIIMLLIAVGFHTTATLAIIIFVLPFINLGRIWVMIIILVSYAIPMVLDVSKYVTEMTYNLSLLDSFNSFTYYLEDEFDEVGRLPIYNTIRSGIFIYAAFNYQKKDKKTDLFYKISLVAVIVHNLLYGAPSYVTRIVFYFDIAFIVFFIKWSKGNVVATSLTIFYAVLYYFHQYIILKHDGVIPFDLL